MLKTIPTLLLFVVSLAFGGILNNVVDDARIEKHWALIVAGSAGWGNFRHQVNNRRTTHGTRYAHYQINDNAWLIMTFTYAI